MRSTPASGRPADVVWHVPTPGLILMGCTPFEAAPRRPCPACGDAVKDRPDITGREAPTVVYCLRCDRMDDRHAGRLARQRCEAEVSRAATDDRDRQERELDHVRDGLKGITLSEAHRRRIWYGYRKSPLAEAEPSCLAVAGREWLAAIDQLPDWSLVLDSKGKVVGRVDWGAETEPEPCPSP